MFEGSSFDSLTTFSTTCGVKQGCPLSPLIFVVYYDILFTKVQKLHGPATAFIDNRTAILPFSRLGDLFPIIFDIIGPSRKAPHI